MAKLITWILRRLAHGTGGVSRTFSTQRSGIQPRWKIKDKNRKLLIWVFSAMVFSSSAVLANEDKVAFLSSKLAEASSFKVRLKAAVLLGRLHDQRAVSPLEHALKDENYVVRGAAARALGNLGPSVAAEAVEDIFPLVQDENQFVQKEARRALQHLASAQSLDYYTSAMHSANVRIRVESMKILASIDLPDARAAILMGLGDEDEEVRAEAIVAVHRLDHSKQVSLLQTALGRNDKFQQQASAVELCRDLSLSELLDPLADLLVSDDVVPTVKTKVAQALRSMKDKLDVEALLPQLASEDATSRNRAIELLGIVASPGAVDALMDLLRHSDPYVRQRVVLALGDAGDSRAVPSLEYLLKTEDNARIKKSIERAIRKLKP